MVRLGQRIRVVPRSFDVHDWNCVETTPHRLVFRPSTRTLLRRLGITLVAAIPIAVLSAFAFQLQNANSVPPNKAAVDAARRDSEALLQSMRESMSEEDWQRIQETAAEQQNERQAKYYAEAEQLENVKSIGLIIVLGVCIFIGALGIAAPLSVLWNRVAIAVVGQSRIAITLRGLLTKSVVTAIDENTRLSVRAVEQVAGRRGWRPDRLGHRWIIAVAPQPSLDLLGCDIESIEIQVHHQKDRPVEGMPLPPRVRTIVAAIERMTGLTAEEYAIMDYQGTQRSLWGNRHVVGSSSGPVITTGTMVGEPRVASRTVRYDEMTPELRAQFEAIRSRAGANENQTIVAEVVSDGGPITYRDANGTVHSYGSMDEMPEEVRAIFEMMRRSP